MQEIDAATRLHGILIRIAHEFKGYLPHEGSSGEFTSANQQLSPDTRTRLALIEDTIDKADKIIASFRAAPDWKKPTENEQRLWNANEKIKAIKAYRERTFEGLAEAYAALSGTTVEEMRRQRGWE